MRGVQAAAKEPTGQRSGVAAGAENPAVAPVFTWREHARRSLWTAHLGDCKPHMLVVRPLGPGEVYARWDCEWCNGCVWAAYLPAQRSGEWPDGLTAYVEELISNG